MTAKYTDRQLDDIATQLRAIWDEHGPESKAYTSRAKELIDELPGFSLSFVVYCAFGVDMFVSDDEAESTRHKRAAKAIMAPYGTMEDLIQEVVLATSTPAGEA